MAARRTIEVDGTTATALEQRAADSGLSVADLLAKLVTELGPRLEAAPGGFGELERQWQAIKAGEPTVSHPDAVRWLDTWGTPGFESWAKR